MQVQVMPNYLMRCLSCKVIIVFIILMVASSPYPSENKTGLNKLHIAKKNFLSRERDYLKAKPLSSDMRSFIKRFRRRVSPVDLEKIKRQEDLKGQLYIVKNGEIEPLENMAEVTAGLSASDPSGFGNFTVIPLIIPITVKTFTNSTICDPRTETIFGGQARAGEKIGGSLESTKGNEINATPVKVPSASTKTSKETEVSETAGTKTNAIEHVETTTKVTESGEIKTNVTEPVETKMKVTEPGERKMEVTGTTGMQTEVTVFGGMQMQVTVIGGMQTEVTAIGGIQTGVTGTTTISNSNFTENSNSSTIDVLAEESSKSTTENEILKKLLTDVEQLISYEKEGKSTYTKEGTVCGVLGDWDSDAGGMQLQLSRSNDTQRRDPIVHLTTQTPDREEGFLRKGHWNITSRVPYNHSSLIMLTAISDASIAVFIGDCMICEGAETMAGSWLLGRRSANCKDREETHTFITDIMRKSNIRKLREQHFKDMTSTTSRTTT